ncbi:RNA polymerase sigma-70 factor, ECF subfamily [Methylobacillus rhizosphaerae]|uniref:RNA polymerase sigma-70 factor, ECF subfamily n=2 Tax=Methylobacillus rhizosphaerae TaxID=551994 RepID=A0A238Z633_9PROT|nr:RNA polymerase sigma-70 factor, ECF subfamily [Methylobacillus rhizosphaerae]
MTVWYGTKSDHKYPIIFMASTQELSNFLAQVERRAFKQTVYAVRDEHVAMDIVQDAMLKLAEKYVSRPVEEYPMLFQRILQNTMKDYWRRQKIRTAWTTLLSSFGISQDEEEHDPLETMPSQNSQDNPEGLYEQQETIAIIEAEIKNLPTRQREAFIMRYWEEMDVAETAAAMGCSEGSVKTHCSRAVHALAAALEKYGFGKEMLEKIGDGR